MIRIYHFELKKTTLVDITNNQFAINFRRNIQFLSSIKFLQIKNNDLDLHAQPNRS